MNSIMSIANVTFIIFSSKKIMLSKSLYQMFAGMMLAFYSHIFYCQEKKRKARLDFETGFYLKYKSGDFLLSHTGNSAVPSAPRGLTSVFGMGTGVTLSTKSPENLKELVKISKLNMNFW